MSLAVLFGLLGYVHGHGIMVWPPRWQDANASQGLEAVLQDSVGKKCRAETQIDFGWSKGGFKVCQWYNEGGLIPGEPTLPEYLKTFDLPENVSLTHMPWMAPGSAPVQSPCGIYMHREQEDKKWKNGTVMETMDWRFDSININFKDAVTTEWKIGSRVEAFWGIYVNHGGGYSYRLCKVPEEGMSGLTEDCFQKTPLRFYGNQQWVQFGSDKSTRVNFDAKRIDIGTTPKGSQWNQNPIPVCAGFSGLIDENKDEIPINPPKSSTNCTHGPQFDPPAPGLYGSGWNQESGVGNFQFNIGDTLEVPDDLEPGKYVLSFRWDSEGNPQIFTTCSSVNLVK